jgi:hypothetical protein
VRGTSAPHVRRNPHKLNVLVVHEEVDPHSGEVLWTVGMSTYNRLALKALETVFDVELKWPHPNEGMED